MKRILLLGPFEHLASICDALGAHRWSTAIDGGSNERAIKSILRSASDTVGETICDAEGEVRLQISRRADDQLCYAIPHHVVASDSRIFHANVPGDWDVWRTETRHSLTGGYAFSLTIEERDPHRYVYGNTWAEVVEKAVAP